MVSLFWFIVILVGVFLIIISIIVGYGNLMDDDSKFRNGFISGLVVIGLEVLLFIYTPRQYVIERPGVNSYTTEYEINPFEIMKTMGIIFNKSNNWGGHYIRNNTNETIYCISTLYGDPTDKIPVVIGGMPHNWLIRINPHSTQEVPYAPESYFTPYPKDIKTLSDDDPEYHIVSKNQILATFHEIEWLCDAIRKDR